MADNLYKSLLRKPGIENMGGWKNRLLFFPEHLMKTIPTLIAGATTTEELALADGTFEFHVATDKPTAIKAVDKTVGMKSENQGEAGGQSFKISGEFFYAGIEAEAAGFARLVNNTEGYLLLISPEGDQYIVGQEGLPVTIKAAFDGGTQRSDRRGFAFTFEADSYVPFIKLKTPIDVSEYFKTTP